MKKLLLFFILLSFYLSVNADSKFHNQVNLGVLSSGDAPLSTVFFDASSKIHSLEEYEDTILLVVFWASWSQESVLQIIQLDKFAKDFRKLPFKIIAISEDFAGVSHVDIVFKKHGIKNLNLYYDDKQNLYNAFKAKTLPSAFLISQNGEKILEFSGGINWCLSSVREQIFSFFQGPFEIPRNSCLNNDVLQNLDK